MQRRRIHEFFGHDGVRTDESIEKMRTTYSVEGSKNVYHPSRGLMKKIPGHSKLTSSAHVFNSVRRLISFAYESGGTWTRKLLAISNDTLYDVNTTSGAFTSLGSSLGTTGVPTFTVIGGKVHIASGPSANVQTYDGSTYAASGGTQPSTPTLADSGSAGNPSGQYYCKVVAVQSDDSLSIASAASSSLVVAGKDITVTCPALGTHKAWKVYMTRGDNPNIFYFSGLTTSTSYTHDLTDENLAKNEELLRHGDAPAAGYRLIASAGDRTWVGNLNGDPLGVLFSDEGLYESFWAQQGLTIPAAGGDELTHMEPEYPRAGSDRVITMVFFTRRAIYNLYGTQPRASDPDPFTLERSKSRVGTIATASVIRAPIRGEDMLLFLTPDRDIRAYDGITSAIISDPVQSVLDRLNLEYAHLSWSLEWPSQDMVFWSIPVDSSQVPNYVLGFNHKEESWFLYPDWTSFLCAVLHYDSNQNEKMYTGEAADATGSLVYNMLTGNDLDGASYDMKYRTLQLVRDGKTHWFEAL